MKKNIGINRVLHNTFFMELRHATLKYFLFDLIFCRTTEWLLLPLVISNMFSQNDVGNSRKIKYLALHFKIFLMH